MTNRLLPLVGRCLMAVIFLISGYGKLMHFGATAAMMASMGVPYATVLLVPTIAIELLGGIMLVIGWQTRLAAFVIFLFLIPVTLVFHNFWAAPAAMVQDQFIHFMKNLAIMGGMLVLAGSGPGGWSVDRR